MSDKNTQDLSARPFSASALKLIAVIMMLADHIAWYWFPANETPGFVMHIFGRITAPLACYFITEGYFKTRNVARYAFRLLVFAVIAQVPYTYYLTGRVAFVLPLSGAGYVGSFNVLFTLLLGLIALRAMDLSTLPRAARMIIAVLCVLASNYSDWPYLGVVFVLVFGTQRGDLKRQSIVFGLVCAVLLALLYQTDGLAMMYQVGMLLTIPLLFLYNGKRGAPSTGPLALLAKYGFYVFYPLHLLILAYIRTPSPF